MSVRYASSWKTQSKVRYLNIAAQINQAYYFDKFLGMIVTGVQRVGKSSYSMKCLAQAAGKWERDSEGLLCVDSDYEAVKPWVVFLPREFLNLVFTYDEEKQRAAIWDDAGFWLFALDWYQPFVKSVSRYIQLAGTQFSTLIMTTPDQTLISGKVLQSLPKMKLCEVREFGRETYKCRPRITTVYERWNWSDGKRGGVRKKWTDRFNAMLPDYFYDQWYFPKRQSYLVEARRVLKKDTTELERKTTAFERTGETEAYNMEQVIKVVGDESKLKEVNEVLDILASNEKAKV